MSLGSSIGRNAARLFCVASFVGGWQAAEAGDVFHVTASLGPQTGEAGFTTVQQVFDELDQQRLNSLVPGYTGVEVTNVAVDFRGLPMLMAYPVQGGPQLQLNIPSLGIARTFNGGTREESRQLLRDFFKNGDALGSIMQALAEVSPVDPIAGNPASLQSRMVAGNFESGFRALASELSSRALGSPATALAEPMLLASTEDGLPASPAAQPSAAVRPGVMAGLDAAHYARGGLSSNVLDVPFNYAFDSSPQRPLALGGALQYADTEGAKTYGANFDLSYRARINERWYLIPSIGYGLSASSDLGSAGQMVSLALTSAFRLFQSADYALWMGNAANATRTLNISIAGYSFDPNLHNVAFTNGLVFSASPSTMWQNYWLEYSVADTRYTGSALYDRRSDELGVTIARVRQSSRGPTTLRAGLSYLNTTHSKGWGVKLQAMF